MNIKISIFVSEKISYKLLETYYFNELKEDSEKTRLSLLEYTNSLSGICNLFLPEHGLHLRHQQSLLSDIIKNKEITNLNVFTHSPSIFSKGYGDKIIFLDNLSEIEQTELIRGKTN